MEMKKRETAFCGLVVFKDSTAQYSGVDTHIHIGYLPDGEMLETESIRQIIEDARKKSKKQDEINSYIADTIQAEISPRGVIVVIKNSIYITSIAYDDLNKPDIKDEFFKLVEE